MRVIALALALALAAAALAAPAFAQDAPAAAPKTKRVCKWLETGNPLDNKRICHDVAVKEPIAAAMAAPAAPAAEPAPAQVAMQSQPHG